LSGTYPNPAVVGLLESGGSALSYGAINSGQHLSRVGASIVGTNIPVFGTEFAHAFNPLFSLNGNAPPLYLTHVSLPFTSLGSGTYRLDWDFTWARSNTGSSFIGQVIGTVSGVVDYIQVEAKQAGTTEQIPAAGFHYITYVGSITEVFRIEFAAESGSGVSYMQRSNLSMYRVL
jgi:hypothetical protein